MTTSAPARRPAETSPRAAMAEAETAGRAILAAPGRNWARRQAHRGRQASGGAWPGGLEEVGRVEGRRVGVSAAEDSSSKSKR